MLILSALISLANLAQDRQAYTKIHFVIEGELNGLAENAEINLGLYEPYETKGTAYKTIVSRGKFRISGETYQPTIGTLALIKLKANGEPQYIYPEAPKLDLFICEGKINVNIADSFSKLTVKSRPCTEQTLLERLNKELDVLNKEIERLYTLQFTSNSSRDTAIYRKTTFRIRELEKQFNPIYSRFIKSHTGSYLAETILRVNMGSVFTIEETEKLFYSLKPGLQKNLMGEEIVRRINLAKNPANNLVGKSIQDAVLTDTSGNKCFLSSYKGKIVLLDFWASWCTPCRKANKEIKELYQKYGNSKFEIVSVSIDTDKRKWKQAIREDQIPWPQYIDDIDPEKPGWYGKAFEQFRGTGVPLSFIIDERGVIHSINPQKENLEIYLKSLYNIQ